MKGKSLTRFLEKQERYANERAEKKAERYMILEYKL
jgi:hypothetical protein